MHTESIFIVAFSPCSRRSLPFGCGSVAWCCRSLPCKRRQAPACPGCPPFGRGRLQGKLLQERFFMVLPFFLPLPGKVVPFPVQRLLIEPLLQRQLQASWQEGELDFLRGRFVVVEIPDLGVSWWLSLGMRGIAMVYGRLQADATLRGELSVFIALAQQQQDPDTLFFRRQLKI